MTYFSVSLQRTRRDEVAEQVLENLSENLSCIHEEIAPDQFQVLVPEASNLPEAELKAARVMALRDTYWWRSFRVIPQP